MSPNPQTPTDVKMSSCYTTAPSPPNPGAPVAVAGGSLHVSFCPGTTMQVSADLSNTGSTTAGGRGSQRLKVEVHTYPVPSPEPAPVALLYSAWNTAATVNDVLLAIPGLSANSVYRVKLTNEGRYADGSFSGVNNGDYVFQVAMNRHPDTPTNLTPPNNSQVILPGSGSIVFGWDIADPDNYENTTSNRDSLGLGAGSVEYQWRQAAYGSTPAGSWNSVLNDSYIYNPPGDGFLLGAFYWRQWQTNTWIEWRARVADRAAYKYGYPVGDTRSWSDFSIIRRFFVPNSTSSPLLLQPVNDIAVIADTPTTFRWQFRDPNSALSQTRADLQYRLVGAPTWVTLIGDVTTPGATEEWDRPAGTFQVGRYEWQVRTYNGATMSPWSPSGTFWAIPAPDSGNATPPVEVSEAQPPLGCGVNRVFIYDRGGLVRRGEITPITHMTWSRKRDDISNALITTNGWGPDCGELLAGLRSWMHEIVIFRDGVRVWEGPVTRVTYKRDQVEIEAKDVMAYIYRRILRQGYNDAYRLVGGVQQGLHTVVERAILTSINCLAYDDPNLIQYLTPLGNADDARQSRVVESFSRTAWQDIDDLAATAGLDYTVSGRRIIYWDTHYGIGLLPEMRDGDFSDTPIVTEYGMQLATDFGVTNNAGIYGLAERPEGHEFYGYVEQLASAYGETVGSAVTEALTPEAQAALEDGLTSQAERNLANRYPTPLIVRVPDNTTLNPDLNIGINQLVPGVHIPLRAVGTLRKVTQIQKLDSMVVAQEKDKETITVVMSPAPTVGGEELPSEV